MAINDFFQYLKNLKKALKREEDGDADDIDSGGISFHEQSLDWHKIGELPDYKEEELAMKPVALKGFR